VQDLDQNEPRQLAGTERAHLPFWSPDSEYIVFAAGRELRKISVQGGASGLVCTMPGPDLFQGAWSEDGESIVFASSGGSALGSLFEVPSQGGSPEELIVPADVGDAVGYATRPAFVSSGRDRILVFTVGGPGASTMHAKNLDTGQTEALGLGDRPIYSAATGHLIYQSERRVYDLWARPFSPETLEFTGPAFPLQQNARQPSLAHDGTLAFLDGSSTGAVTLVWRDRAGTLLEVVGQQQPTMLQPALSPDGQRVAVTSYESGNADIWVHYLVRSTKTRLTFDPGTERNSTWSASGEEISDRGVGADGWSLRSTAADGTGEPAVLVEASKLLLNPSWSRDGRYLVYEESNPETGPDIRYLQIETDGSASEPVIFLASPTAERSPKLSPDGRLVAYASYESGRPEIYVRPFPEGTGRRQVSVNGGRKPRWSSDGTELYYVQGTALMVVSVSTGQGVTLGQPQQLFQSPELAVGASSTSYDVSADSQRFIMVAPVEDDEANAAPPKIRIVQNWYEEFRDREQ